MKRIVKRTTTTEEWIDPDTEDQEVRKAADDSDLDEDIDEQDESENQDEDGKEEAPARRRRSRR